MHRLRLPRTQKEKMNIRTCTKCNIEKEFTEYRKDKKGKYGISSRCRSCRNKVDTAYYQQHREERKIQDKIYRDKTKEARSKYQKQYRIENKESLRIYFRQYTLDNKEKINEGALRRHTTRYYNDIQFRLAIVLRKRLYMALVDETKKGSAVDDLGCSVKELKQYLESKFQPDMTWENWGIYGWHIDHIRPMASFDLTKREELLQACHYTNLQPLWVKDHKQKTKIDIANLK